ncbi:MULTISPECIES: ArsR/SmtB family transcription factor [Saliphagus]|uniref:ArsR/SmtB family transcription factor n=1 Tax=Saliphagus infecundisoli TaxID=1849069 RepID=A0ABD5QAQ9_9EURY|nr:MULTISPECIES: helix-turn-helix domain-containing protein [Saliphagus]
MPREANRSRYRDAGEQAPQLLDLVGDEYTREVLCAIAEQPRSATEVAAATSVSKPTAFRRLDRLEEFGLVEGVTVIDPEHGHHHERFRATFRGAVVEFGSEGFSVVLETDPE